MTFKIGDLVRVAQDNDNECYADFKDKILKITIISRNTEDHQGYDMSLYPMELYDLEDLEGNDIPCSLYEYELEYA